MPAPIPDLSRDQQCHHYQAPSGQRCGSPALKGEYYCYHHIVKQAARSNRRVLIDPEITRMEIPPIEDRASIFIALAAVVHQVAMRALEPPPSHRATNPGAPGSSQSHRDEPGVTNGTPRPAPASPCQHPPVQPATDQQPATPRTIPISKESLLYFLRSRHCASCNAELFPASELTERPNAGAPPEVIEEARRALPAPQPATDNLQPATVLPSLQAVAEESAGRWTTHKSGCPIHDSCTVMGGERHRNPHSPPRLLYTHLGARYPRDLRIQSGACLHQTVRPHRILHQ
jgi:hypothetical protein